MRKFVNAAAIGVNLLAVNPGMAQSTSDAQKGYSSSVEQTLSRGEVLNECDQRLSDNISTLNDRTLPEDIAEDIASSVNSDLEENGKNLTVQAQGSFITALVNNINDISYFPKGYEEVYRLWQNDPERQKKIQYLRGRSEVIWGMRAVRDDCIAMTHTRIDERDETQVQELLKTTGMELDLPQGILTLPSGTEVKLFEHITHHIGTKKSSFNIVLDGIPAIIIEAREPTTYSYLANYMVLVHDSGIIEIIKDNSPFMEIPYNKN